MKQWWNFRACRRPARPPRRIRPSVEVLEDRLCPATLTVTTLNDTSTAAATSGSLRQVLAQNVSDGGGDTIVFAAGLNGTMALSNAAGFGTLTNGGKSVTIANPNGDTITISGQNAIEDLDLSGGTGVSVSISGQSVGDAGSLTFTSGKAALNGGGIANDATTGLTDVSVTDNTAPNFGGGIYNDGTLTLTGVTVSGNSVASNGGGIYNAEYATLTVIGSTISGNTAEYYGGGIYNSGYGDAKLTSSTLSGNLAEVSGGGIYNTANGVLTLTYCTVSGNTVSAGVAIGVAYGGGIYNNGILNITSSTLSGNSAVNPNSGGRAAGGGIYDLSSLTITASTISGNSVSTPVAGLAEGGGIYLSTAGSFSGTNDTIWDNGATGTEAYGGGIYVEALGHLTLTQVTLGDCTVSGSSASGGGGIYISGTSTVVLVNTIVWDPSGPSGSPDVSGTIATTQNDEFFSLTGATITNNLGGNLFPTNALLGPLGYYGGPTQTVEELPGAPSIDAGADPPAGFIAAAVDQRGEPRPDIAGSKPDIGAFEFQAGSSGPIPTTPGSTSIVGLSVVDEFGLVNELETVSGQVIDDGTVVSGGSVTITDAGQSQTVSVDANGNFSATFEFNLLQEFFEYAPHSIDVSYGGATVAGTTFDPSSAGISTPNNFWNLWFQLILLEDYLTGQAS